MRITAVLCIALLVAAGAFAQVSLRAQGQVSLATPVAVPNFAAPPGQEDLGRRMAQVVGQDLEFSGLFSILSPSLYPQGFTGFTSDLSQVRLDTWAATNIEYLVYAYVSETPTSVVAECRLFDVAAGSQVFGKRFTADQKWWRLVAHQYADEIVYQLTGTHGVATSQIAFSGGNTGKKELYIADYDGANPRQVTQHGSISILPKFSPDGKKLAYLSYKDSYPFLYILDLPSGTTTALSRRVGLNASPAWAPDGNTLAMTLSVDGNPELYLINADGTNPRRITNNKAVDTQPAFSPDGSRIAFVSDRQGTAIWVMPAAGGDAQRLTFQGGRASGPAWSPDGKMIAYVVESGGAQIYAMNADGTGARPLTQSGGSKESPSWSPDSRHVIYTSSGRLWAVNVETGKERQVQGLNMYSQGPSWGPRRK